MTKLLVKLKNIKIEENPQSQKYNKVDKISLNKFLKSKVNNVRKEKQFVKKKNILLKK